MIYVAKVPAVYFGLFTSSMGATLALDAISIAIAIANSSCLLFVGGSRVRWPT